MNQYQIQILDLRSEMEKISVKSEIEKLVVWQLYNLSDLVCKMERDTYEVLPIVRIQTNLLQQLAIETNNTYLGNLISSFKYLLGEMR